MMRRLYLVLLSTAACTAMVDGANRPSNAPHTPELFGEPPWTDGRCAPITHLLLTYPAGPAVPPDAFLVKGSVTSRDLRDLALDLAAPALQKRVVATTVWTDDNSVVVAPRAALELDAIYTVAVPSLSWSQRIRVMERDPVPHLKRVWPPVEQSATASFAAWCLEEPAPGRVQSAPRAQELGPGAVAGVLDHGALRGWGIGCVHWQALEAQWGPVVPPPLVEMPDGSVARLEPTPLEITAEQVPKAQPTECPADRPARGPGCMQVLDDRVVWEAHNSAALMAVSIGELMVTTRLDEAQRLVLRPLAPDAALVADVMFMDAAGLVHADQYAFRTQAAQPHVVINEVMANPAGREPDQEWVELYNDGLQPVELEGWVVQDVGGSAVLPPLVLEPGHYALVVNSSYDPNDWVDRPPAPGTPLLRVEHLGKAGLSNEGEPLRLLRADGAVASSVPALASSKQSVSWARKRPDAPDEAEWFGPCAGGGTPGAPNECAAK